MKCLINCTGRDTLWIEEYFPGSVAYMLRIANKPYLEYLIEFCVLNKIQSVKIIMEQSEPEIEEVLGKGERWGIQLSYGLTPPEMSIEEIVFHNKGALGDDDLLIFDGMFWLDYDQRDFKPFKVAPNDVVCCGRHCVLVGRNRNNGTSFLAGALNVSEESQGISALSSVKDFYGRSMALVRGEADQYSMPSYSNNPNIYIGQNVSLCRTADIREPVHLGNIVQIGEHTQIGPSAIIGDNSFIDDCTVVQDSVIMGSSYLGCYLEIIGKIVYRNIIINPENGLKIDIIDDFVLTPIPEEERSSCDFYNRFAALLLWIIQLIPFLLLRPTIKISTDDVECYLNADQRKKIKLKLYVQPPKRWSARWFRKLSLDRFHLLPMVMRGELRLVGSLILPVNEANGRLLKQFPDYSPGLFSFSEMLEHEKDRFQSEMDELYYIYHANFKLNWQIIRKTLVRNLLKAM